MFYNAQMLYQAFSLSNFTSNANSFKGHRSKRFRARKTFKANKGGGDTVVAEEDTFMPFAGDNVSDTNESNDIEEDLVMSLDGESDSTAERDNLLDEDIEMSFVPKGSFSFCNKRFRLTPPPPPFYTSSASNTFWCVNNVTATVKNEKEVTRYFFSTNTYAMPEYGGTKRFFCNM
ncbi:unnamed protein product [Mucor hiemalis]